MRDMKLRRSLEKVMQQQERNLRQGLGTSVFELIYK